MGGDGVKPKDLRDDFSAMLPGIFFHKAQALGDNELKQIDVDGDLGAQFLLVQEVHDELLIQKEDQWLVEHVGQVDIVVVAESGHSSVPVVAVLFLVRLEIVVERHCVHLVGFLVDAVP
jgi:hypothetical protein